MGKKTRQRDALERMMMAQMEKMNAPNPNLEALKNYNRSILDWHTGTGVKDLAKHPSLGAKLPTYELAKTFRDQGRVGRGLMGLGATKKGQDASYSTQLADEQATNRALGAAGMLETGLQNELAASQQNLAALEAQDVQRMTASNGLMQYYHGDLSARIASGSWANFAKGLAMAAVPALIGGFTGGFGGGGKGGSARPSTGGASGSPIGGSPVGHH